MKLNKFFCPTFMTFQMFYPWVFLAEDQIWS